MKKKKVSPSNQLSLAQRRNLSILAHQKKTMLNAELDYIEKNCKPEKVRKAEEARDKLRLITEEFRSEFYEQKLDVQNQIHAKLRKVELAIVTGDKRTAIQLIKDFERFEIVARGSIPVLKKG